MRRAGSRLRVLAAAGLAAAGLAGVAVARVAQEQPGAPPSDAGAAPPPIAPADAAPGPSNVVDGDVAASAPPDEAAPPAASTAQTAVAAAPGPPAPPPPPLARPRYETAVLQAVDKVTAETLRFEARVGEPVRYKGLVLTVRACEGAAADEDRADSLGYLEIDSQPAAVPGRPTTAPRQVFHGWMTAGSPGLNPLQSPGYDVWVIACKTPAPSPTPPSPGQA